MFRFRFRFMFRFRFGLCLCLGLGLSLSLGLGLGLGLCFCLGLGLGLGLGYKYPILSTWFQVGNNDSLISNQICSNVGFLKICTRIKGEVIRDKRDKIRNCINSKERVNTILKSVKTRWFFPEMAVYWRNLWQGDRLRIFTNMEGAYTRISSWKIEFIRVIIWHDIVNVVVSTILRYISAI